MLYIINILYRNRPVAKLVAITEEKKEYKADWHSHSAELKKYLANTSLQEN